MTGAGHHITLESSDAFFFGGGFGGRLHFAGRLVGLLTETQNAYFTESFWLYSTFLLAFIVLGLADVSMGRRGWRLEWHEWVHALLASGALVGWQEPGRARQKAEAAVTAQRTQLQQLPGARTGRLGPKASSYLSGMQVLPIVGETNRE
jgi:hypothetical protein